MADFIVKNQNSEKPFLTTCIRPHREAVCDEELRARRQPLQSAGFEHARRALDAELSHRERKEQTDA